MTIALHRQVLDALAAFSSRSRLLDFSVGDARSGPCPGSLLVEAFAASDGVQEAGWRDVIVLSTSAALASNELLGQTATLSISLADGSRDHFSGEISEAAMLGSDGGLARYRIRIQPWVWRLEQVRNCRVWQDKSVVEIVDAVLSAYQPAARWRWSEDVGSFMADVPARSYCCQYRESDLAFVGRLLAEEGLCWRIEQLKDGPGLVLFADSRRLCAVPQDASSAAGGGIRFHGARSVEESDSIQALVAQRMLHASLSTVLSADYKGTRVVGASSPSHFVAGKGLPELESFEAPGQYAYADRHQAQHYADMHMEGIEARGQLWRGRSTLRTLRAGTRAVVEGTPVRQLGKSGALTVLKVFSIGVNNMPPPAQHALSELFGPIPELLEEVVPRGIEGIELAIAQALETGYANCFEAVCSELPWRPSLPDGDGGRHSKPVAHGAQSAIVVGADGSDYPNSADEVYCDRLGRIRIRFHWQDDRNAGCWVRVAQRSAGGGFGQQFLPRIGQEVCVQFLENDIDRPVVVGALYNGQGEGGVVRTPGGRCDSVSDQSCFNSAHDHAVSGQGNLSGGNSPVWHGTSADSAGHRNGAAQWGIRSKEFGGCRYSQLLFDDSDGHSRVQVKTMQAGTEANIGHLIHMADNYRGGFRGKGVELRTDAYGAVRAGAGLLVSSYQIMHSTAMRDSSGHNAAGIALMKRVLAMAEVFSAGAATHQAVELAAYVGMTKEDKSLLDSADAPLKAIVTSLSGMVSSRAIATALADASAKNTKGTDGYIPNLSDPIISISAQDNFTVEAGQCMQLSTGEGAVLLSGGDTQLLAGDQMRLHSEQVIGVLAGAVKEGGKNVGVQLIASQGGINLQAQADNLKLVAKEKLEVISVKSNIDLASAKDVILSTVGGANITITAGNISIQCPGTIKVMAGRKKFSAQSKLGFEMPELPRANMPYDEKFQLLDFSGDPVANMRFAILKSDGGRIEGVTDKNGMLPLQQSFSSEKLRILILGKV